MTTRKTKTYPKSKGEGRIAEQAAAYGRGSVAGGNFPKPIRFKTSVLRSMGKPIRIVKLTKEEISAKVADLYERAVEKSVTKKPPKRSTQRSSTPKITRTGAVSTARKRER